MGKCAKCSWKGSAKAYQKHYAAKHFKKKKDVGKVAKFKIPGFAKKKKRR
jgi:hypothetical protein